MTLQFRSWKLEIRMNPGMGCSIFIDWPHAKHKIEAPGEEEGAQVQIPTNVPPLIVTEEDRLEALAIGSLGSEMMLLDWLAAHRRQKREAYALLAQKNAWLDEMRAKRLQDAITISELEHLRNVEKGLREKAEAEGVKSGLKEAAMLICEYCRQRPETPVEHRMGAIWVHPEIHTREDGSEFDNSPTCCAQCIHDALLGLPIDSELATLRKRVEELEADLNTYEGLTMWGWIDRANAAESSKRCPRTCSTNPKPRRRV